MWSNTWRNSFRSSVSSKRELPHSSLIQLRLIYFDFFCYCSNSLNIFESLFKRLSPLHSPCILKWVHCVCVWLPGNGDAESESQILIFSSNWEEMWILVEQIKISKNEFCRCHLHHLRRQHHYNSRILRFGLPIRHSINMNYLWSPLYTWSAPNRYE